MIVFRIVTLLLLSYQTVSEIHVVGSIRSDKIWTKFLNPYYVTGNIDVLTSVTLTIEAGVNIIFLGDYEILIKGGSLRVLGTSKHPVLFLSMFSGSKWMVTFKSCDLSQSSIISAQFSGSKPAVQLAFDRNGLTQNEGSLVMQSCLFMDGIEIGSNGPVDHHSSTDYSVWESSLVLKDVFIFNSKLTTNHRKHKQPIHIINSYIDNSTLLIVDYESVVLLRSCFIKNTQIELMFNSRLSMVSIEDSILIDVDIKANVEFYRINGLLLIRQSIFQYGSILGDLTGVNILIDDSILLYVNIKSLKKSFGYHIATFILHHSTFHYGSISTMDHQSNLIGSNIILNQSPIVMGDNSKILCTSVTRTIKTTINTIGIDASSITIKDSSIYNFQIGIRIFEASTILSSNIYQNSLYNIENRGPYNIQAEGNWWGTSIEININSKIHNDYDNFNVVGKVIYSNYSLTPIEPTNTVCSNDLTETTTTKRTTHSTKMTSTTSYYTSKSSINYNNIVTFYCVFIFLVRFFFVE